MSFPCDQDWQTIFPNAKTFLTRRQIAWLLVDLFVVTVIYAAILLLLLFIAYELLYKREYYHNVNLTLFYVFALLCVASRCWRCRMPRWW